MGYCPQFTSDLVLRDITHREHLIITFSASTLVSSGLPQELLRLPSPAAVQALFVRKRPLALSLHWISGSGEIARQSRPSPGTSCRGICQGVPIEGGRSSTRNLGRQGQCVRGTRIQILPNPACSNISQPRSSYEDAYNKPSEQMVNLEIDNNQLARTNRLTSTCSALDPLSGISSLNLIVECGEFSCLASSSVVDTEFVGVVTRRRKLQFNCALFERKPGSFGFAGRTFVEAFSGQTMKTVWDAASSYIESHLKHGTNTKYRIQVYKV